MFLSKNKKIMYTPVNLSFAIYKWGVRGYSLQGHVCMRIASDYKDRSIFTCLWNQVLFVVYHADPLNFFAKFKFLSI